MIPKPPKRKKPPVKVYPCGREVCSKTVAGRGIYTLRTMQMVSRQHWKCAICGRDFGYRDDETNPATFDHALGRGMGAAIRDDRIEIDGQWNNAALCLNCNTAKGSRKYHWLDGKYIPK